MPATLALALCLLAILVLLWIERTRPPAASWALWLPTLWMMIMGSRPVSRWIDLRAANTPDGSLPDRLALATMIALGCVVVLRRKVDWGRFITANFWLLLFFLYIGMSALWTDVPFIGVKRWIKSAGVIVMALVVMSEAEPLRAFERIVRRCAYVLLPLSLLFIKYFPEYGRAYGRWDGNEMWTGVTTQKNTLGALCALTIVVLVISMHRGRDPRQTAPTRAQWYADVFIGTCAAYLLAGPGRGMYSATAIAVTIVGMAVCWFLLTRQRGGRFTAAHMRGIAVAAAIAYVLVGSIVSSTGATMLGRRTDLTGRATEIWPFVLEEAARHPILGSGYGGVWGLNGHLSVNLGIEQAHNGYLDVYLQLGIVGCVLLALFLLEVCARIGGQFQQDRRWGIFGVAFLSMNLVYNLSETAFFDAYLGAALVIMAVVFSNGRGTRTDTAGEESSVPAGFARDGRERVRRFPVSRPHPGWTVPQPTGQFVFEEAPAERAAAGRRRTAQAEG
jgi:O-antigen ligase